MLRFRVRRYKDNRLDESGKKYLESRVDKRLRKSVYVHWKNTSSRSAIKNIARKQRDTIGN